MPLLLYCVGEAADERDLAPHGVAGLAVGRFTVGDLAGYFSESDAVETWLRLPLRAAALQFHGVLMQFFETATIIPFRFPTVFEDEQAFRTHVEARSAEYQRLLARFHNKAQMDVRVTAGRQSSTITSSGMEFLRDRQTRLRRLDSAEHVMRERTREIVIQWLRHNFADGFRASALVDRDHLATFKETLAGIRLDAHVQVRVSGPWPVSAFVNVSAERET